MTLLTLLKHYERRSQEQGWVSETFCAEGERDTFAMLQDFHFKNSAANMWLVMLLKPQPSIPDAWKHCQLMLFSHQALPLLQHVCSHPPLFLHLALGLCEINFPKFILHMS
jgi:hypothetical protein